ncbi:beta-phosphoglucomutase [Olivibacter sitiensis]|uniref:beta-phosphoglucomutase n=1 Tax=Olivibacter sitiensis TaxID=376470 RepID=UPI0004245D4C|nr:beta-phosphoglucomutase [Olivibacter sitiensis]
MTGIPQNIKGLIFDLDGVLVDTAVFHFQAWKRLANTLGYDFTERENEQLKGVSRVQSLQLILKWAGIEKTEAEQEALAAKKNDWYLELVNQMKMGDTLPGAEEFLKESKAAGYKIALGSASKNARLILEKTGIIDYFDAIIDGNGVSASKPDPEVFLKGAEALGVEPADCLVFEDAQAGIDAARVGGMHVVGIGKAEDLHGTDFVIRDLRGLKVGQR